MNATVLGETHMDAIAEILGTGYLTFSSPLGVRGLARATDGHLEILAVNSPEQGKGCFRNFIAQCKSEFKIVTVWEIWNPMLHATLTRYGFEPIETWENGEKLTGLQWAVGEPKGGAV